MGAVGGKAAERSEAGFPPTAGDRSIVPGPVEAVTKRDRRRSRGTSPNSRQSRRLPSSSHLQDGDHSMDGSIALFAGVDVSKRSLDLCLLPDDRRQSFSYDEQGLAQLSKALPAPGTCRIVVEATGGYQRAVVAELVNAGHLVAVVNPRQVRDFARVWGSSPRPIGSMPMCLPAIPSRRSRGPSLKSRKKLQNSSNWWSADAN